MKAKTIIKHIQESELSTTEIHEIWDVLRAKSDAIRQVAVYNWSRGDYVKFTGRQGREIHGIVNKRNRKTVTVQPCSDGKIWRVGPDMLSESSIEEYDDAKQSNPFGTFPLRVRGLPE